MIQQERKRKRIAVSCTLCRRRKIRCNRETPCNNCIRSRNVACVYETMPMEKLNEHVPLQEPRITGIEPPAPSKPSMASTSPMSQPLTTTAFGSPTVFELETMRSRIVELEEKLSQAGSTNASIYSTTASRPAPTHPVHITTSFAGPFDVLQDSRAFGQTHAISRSISHKNRVFGQSHWMNGFVVFRDIIEMIEPPLRSGSSTVLANLTKAKSLARIIKAQRAPTWPAPPTRDLPPKDICDSLVDGYLRIIEALYRILHIPSFQKEYEAVWQANAEPSTGFFVLLKLVLAIGASVYDENFSMRTQALNWVYEAQTWISSPLIKSKLGIQYMQISLLLLLARETLDVGSELVWISAGSTLRAAMYIGLHKDPLRLPRMTLLEAEMRRRIWSSLLEILLQTSLGSGGSCTITAEDFNTEPPGNFDDEDLLAVDPTAKPSHTYTQTSITVALRKTFASRLAVIRFLNDLSSAGTYKETLRIDTMLRATYKILRSTLQAFSPDAASTPSKFALQSVDFILQRFISALHVPFLGPSLQDPVYAFSRKAVVDASAKIWALALSTPSAFEVHGESDLNRFCRNGAGFFRTSAYHASTFLGVDLRAQVQEDDDISSIAFYPGRSTVIDEASDWYLCCMKSGETAIKGYLLLGFLSAQVDATRRHVNPSEVPNLLIKAAEEAAERAVALLEKMTGQEQGAADLMGLQDFDIQMAKQDLIEDWDLIMSDSYRFAGGGTFNAFLG